MNWHLTDTRGSRPAATASALAAPSPFAWGRNFDGAAPLVGRDAERAELGRAIRNRGRLILSGPRRFGKTSLLAAAEAEAGVGGSVVLRVDAESYETSESLAAAILTGAVRARRGPPDRLAALLGRAAPHLRARLETDPSTGELSVRVGAASSDVSPVALFTGALDAVGQLAAEWGRNVVVVLDEVMAALGDPAGAGSRELAAVMRRHPRVGFVLCSSDPRLPSQVGDRSDPFRDIGGRIELGPVPAGAFVAFLDGAFRGGGLMVDDGACDRILERAGSVPYNVQRLAGTAWDLLRSAAPARPASPGYPASPDTGAPRLTRAVVDRAVSHIVRGDDPAYTQLWTSLTTNQKKTLRAAIERGGSGLQSGAVSRRYDISPASVQVALSGLEDRQVLRRDPGDRTRYLPVDPFLADWLRLVRR